MGPAILVDKSTLQMLSGEEMSFLRQYYSVVYCPTLFFEILGDLAKHQDISASKREVFKVACKVNGIDSFFTAPCKQLIVAELLGHKVHMDGRPVISGAQKVVDCEGQRGVFIDEQPEFEALRKWTQGKFSEIESDIALDWRNRTRQVDFADTKEFFGSMKINDINEMKCYIDALVDIENGQSELLVCLLQHATADGKTRDAILSRWRNANSPLIKKYAPYCYYFLRVLLMFSSCVAKSLIGAGKRGTNLIDIEYLFYLPFCKSFTSNDIFLRDFSALFLTEEQSFVWGQTLKADLKSFSMYWKERGNEERSKHQKMYGNYPPDLADSITCQMWKKWAGDRRTQCRLTHEEKQKIAEMAKSIRNAD